MLKHILTFFLLFFYLCPPASAHSLQTTNFITEKIPPYSYFKDNKLCGASIEILMAALNAAGVRRKVSEIHVYPWARGYQTTLVTPNTCLFSTIRNPKRESSFKWVGPIGETNFIFLSLKDTVAINSFQDINKYRIGVIRKGIAHQTLRAKGISKKRIDLSTTISTMVEKLIRKRVDIIMENENVLHYVLKKQNLNLENFQTNYAFNLGELYFAFNKDTDNSVVEKLQHGVNMIRENGTLYKIIEKYSFKKVQ